MTTTRSHLHAITAPAGSAPGLAEQLHYIHRNFERVCQDLADLADLVSSSVTNLTGTLILPGVTCPPIAATQHDYNPSGLSTAGLLRVESSAAVEITGLAGGQDGRLLAVVNVGAFDITLANQDTGSATWNRFAFATGRDHVLTASQYATAFLWYDGTDHRWVSLSPTTLPTHVLFDES